MLKNPWLWAAAAVAVWWFVTRGPRRYAALVASNNKHAASVRIKIINTANGAPVSWHYQDDPGRKFPITMFGVDGKPLLLEL